MGGAGDRDQGGWAGHRAGLFRIPRPLGSLSGAGLSVEDWRLTAPLGGGEERKEGRQKWKREGWRRLKSHYQETPPCQLP